MLVFLTGATGFVGSHITSQLLEAGHSVRAVIRTGRSERLRSIFPTATESQLQTIEVVSNDQADYSAALKDVDAVIHCASPGSQGETKDVLFNGGYKGTKHLLESAIAAGVKKIIVTGSIASLVSENFAEALGTKALDDNDYNSADITTFDLESVNDHGVYQAVKTLTDKLVWSMAKQHTDVDFTVLVIPMNLGPYVPNYPLIEAEPSLASMGTPWFPYSLISSTGPQSDFNPFWHMVDVRDSAKAHVLALTTPPSTKNKRFLVSSKQITRKEILEVIRNAHPELAHRLPDDKPVIQFAAPFDLSFTESSLGLKEYIPWKDSILQSLGEGLKLEERRASIREAK